MTDEANRKRVRSLHDMVHALGLDLSSPGEVYRRTSAVNDSTYAPVAGADFFRVCGDTERTAHLTRIAGYALGQGMDAKGVTELCLGWNERNEPPLDEAKVCSTVTSIARTHGRNHPPEQRSDEPLFDLNDARVDRYLDAQPPARRWLLNDCLPLGKVGLLVAPGGTGKSQLALQLAIAVATGGTLAGWWAVGEPGPVLALFGEEDEEELHRRLRAVLRALNATPDGSAHETAVRSNLFLKSMVGESSLMTRLDNGNAVARTNVAERLCATVKEVPNVKLVIIDPVSRFRGGDENVAEHATRFVEAAELIAKETGATVLLLHHANKASSKDAEQNQSAARGSSALTDGVRFQMNLALLTDKQADELGLEDGTKHEYVAVKVTKNNYAPTGDTVFLHRGDQGVLSRYEAQEARRASTVSRMQQLVELVRELSEKDSRHSKSSLSRKYGGVHGPFKMGVNALDKLISQAIEEGFLKQMPGSAHVLRPTGKQVGIQKAQPVLPDAHVHGGA